MTVIKVDFARNEKRAFTPIELAQHEAQKILVNNPQTDLEKLQQINQLLANLATQSYFHGFEDGWFECVYGEET